MAYTTAPQLSADNTAPAVIVATVTPSDSVQLSELTRAIYVGGAGNVAVTMANGSTATFYSVPAGAVLPIRPTLIMATGTTATNMVALS